MIYAISTWKITPTGLGLAFFGLISVPISLFAVFTDTPSNTSYLSYVDNISWSVSILVLFPLIVALSLKYHRDVADGFTRLHHQIEAGDGDQFDAKGYFTSLEARVNSRWVIGFALTFSLLYSLVSLHQILNQDHGGWMSSGSLLLSIGNPERGLTWVGAVAILLQFTLVYWSCNLLWRGLQFSWTVLQVFGGRRAVIRLEPFDPDQCAGLRYLGRLTLLQNFILGLFGMYMALRIIDKFIVQGEGLFDDAGALAQLTTYAIAAPLLFFIPVFSIHRYMKRSWTLLLLPAEKLKRAHFERYTSSTSDEAIGSSVQELATIEDNIQTIRGCVPVWPFRFRTIPILVAIFQHLLVSYLASTFI
ncbi:MAG: hypothetical protein ABJH63_05125 [Rhizobiaceae bacterium]